MKRKTAKATIYDPAAPFERGPDKTPVNPPSRPSSYQTSDQHEPGTCWLCKEPYGPTDPVWRNQYLPGWQHEECPRRKRMSLRDRQEARALMNHFDDLLGGGRRRLLVTKDGKDVSKDRR